MKKVLLTAAVLALVGCLDDSGDSNDLEGFEPRLAIAEQSADYATSDVGLVGDTDSEDDVVTDNVIATTDPSDIAIAIDGDNLYRIGRYGFDNVTKYSWDDDSLQLEIDWQYSVVSEEDSGGNPQDFVVYNTSTAYVSLRGSSHLLKVDPNATSGDDFILDEIDLSAFAHEDASGIPYMTDLVILGDKLYVMLERLALVLVEDPYWGDYYAQIPTDSSWVVVLDAATGQIIAPDNDSLYFDSETDSAADFKIDLITSNALNFAVNGSTIYASGRGDYYYAGDLVNDSAIVSFQEGDTEATVVLDETYDGVVEVEGHFWNVDVNDDGDLYFSTYVGWGDNNVYFADSLGDVIGRIDLGEADSYNVSAIASDDDEVYIGVYTQSDGSENPGIKVFNVNSTADVDGLYPLEDDFYETTYNPTQIEVF